jgi:ribonuclease D
MTVHFHEEDLPEGVLAPGPVAVDTEAMGLHPGRDRLCLVQISDGRGDEHLVRFGPESDYSAPNLKAVLTDPERLKLYHFARFDLAIMRAYLGVMAEPVYCTKTASRLVRTYTDRHGLKELIKELSADRHLEAAAELRLGRSGAFGRAEGLCRLRRSLPPPAEGKARRALEREGRTGLAQACFDFLPHGRCSISPDGPRSTSSPMSELAERDRAVKRGWARPGSAHDWLVRLLKIVLPMASAFCSLICSSRRSAKNKEVSFLLDKKKVDVAHERMKTQTAQYRGVDDQGRPFTVQAEKAVQKTSNVPIIDIDGMAAQIQLTDGPATIAAGRARYHMDQQKADVVGPITSTAPTATSSRPAT